MVTPKSNDARFQTVACSGSFRSGKQRHDCHIHLSLYGSAGWLHRCTGLRISEVMGLPRTGINFESLAMEIREGYARSQVTKLKSECSQDELPLDPDVAAILLEWKRLCPETTDDWVSNPRDGQTLRFWLAAEEGTQNCGITGEDSGTDRLALAVSQLPLSFVYVVKNQFWGQ